MITFLCNQWENSALNRYGRARKGRICLGRGPGFCGVLLSDYDATLLGLPEQVELDLIARLWALEQVFAVSD